MNNIIKKLVDKTVSYKFIPLMYQIFSRIGMSSRSHFQATLNDLVVRMSVDHPYHTLPQLFALANEDQVGDYQGGAQYKNNLSSERISTANKVLQRIRSAAKLVNLVQSTTDLLGSYNRLARASTIELQKRTQCRNISFKEIQPRGCTFVDETNSIISVYRPFVITATPIVRKDANYEAHVVRIDYFNERFSITDSGVSRPKIIECRGDDGLVYRQLVKGGDDMRQDAVMQQVILGNAFLMSSGVSQERFSHR